MSGRIAVALLGLAALALAGCTGGSPSTPDSRRATLTQAPLPTTPKVTLAPRPRTVLLDRVDPCALLTAKQRKTLGMDRAPISGTYPEMGDAKVCDFRDSTRAVTVRLGLVLTQGAGVWLDDAMQGEAQAIQVHGFPALMIKTAGQSKFCNVAVDVAEGQFLDVQFGDAGNKTPPELERLCAGAQEAAVAAMTTLLGPR